MSRIPCPQRDGDKGSQFQIRAYVDQHIDILNSAIADALLSLRSLHVTISWVSPLRGNSYVEYRDEDFLRAVGLEYLAPKLVGDFWPKTGPCWDALAAVEISDSPESKGVILLEAKSHRDEIYDKNRHNWVPESEAKIRHSIKCAKQWLGVADNVDWTGRLYQRANRLAHLYFFREVVHVPAWLANIYFLNDTTHLPTTLDEWQVALPKLKAELGLTGVDVPYMADVFLPAISGGK